MMFDAFAIKNLDIYLLNNAVCPLLQKIKEAVEINNRQTSS